MSERSVHKGGSLKQHNKSHKNGRHKSKGQSAGAREGRVEMKARGTGRKGFKDLRKADRRNQQKQLRANKRQEAVDAKRQLGVTGRPPHLVVVVPLSEGVNVDQIHSLLCLACDLDDDPVPTTTPPPTLVNLALKQRFTVAYACTNHLYSLLDLAKVADTLLLVHSAGTEAGTEWSTPSSLVLDCLMAQGLPSTVHLVQGLDFLTGKALAAAKKVIQKAINVKFPGNKLLHMDTRQQAEVVLRVVSTHKRRGVLCRDQHPHLLVERLSSSPGEDGKVTLSISGYVRSRILSVNSLLHIPGLGDYQMSQVDSPEDPHPFLASSGDHGMAVDGPEGFQQAVKVLEVADPTKQVSLQSEVVPDPMVAEQTWPSEQELSEAAAIQEKRVAKRVPKGTSDYQAAWIVETDSEHEEEDGSDLEEMEGEGVWSGGEEEEESSEEELEELCTDQDTATLPDTEMYDADTDMDSEQRQLQRLRAERDHVQFPDEIDTPTNALAKIRFQKYRGLKSFRTSPWNPLENLPPDYARIFQFENFNLTKKKALRAHEEEGALPGWYVTLHVIGVPSDYAEKLSSPLVVYGLLPHENKMSVLHYVLRRTSGSLPIRSKDELVFHTGIRRFSARPIFSQHSAGDKHKFERFFPQEGCCVASVYAPIGYPPQPILVFKHQELQGGGEKAVLVAVGSLHRVQPQRVVCKRIVLSGHLYKINKRSAVIRYMFFNREDIDWFKPVELRTKCGRRGHIKETLGTHGHMKCVFDGQLKAQDTVLMYLYKRVYPKWSYCPDVVTPISWDLRLQHKEKLEKQEKI